MPPKPKVTRERIIRGAVEYLRKEGGELSARALAGSIGISTQPVFSHFSSMEEVKKEALREIYALYEKKIEEEEKKGLWPTYKAAGMGYIRFAKEEPNLFKLLFMRNREKGETSAEDESFSQMRGLVEKTVGLSPEQADRFHFEMWTCVHGMASMIATGYLSLTEEEISQVLTDVYQALRGRSR